jgi:hypothetical protein
MSVFNWPTGGAFVPLEVTLLERVHQEYAESVLTGDAQVNTLPGSRWGWRFDFGAQTVEHRLALEGFLTSLTGREHRTRLHDVRHPRPLGTIQLAGVTLGAAAAQFATSLALAGCGANTTLRSGSWLALPGQLLRVVGDAQANAGGAMVVEVRHRLRAAWPSGTVVTLEKPTALYTRATSEAEYPRIRGTTAPPFSVEFTEAFTA